MNKTNESTVKKGLLLLNEAGLKATPNITRELILLWTVYFTQVDREMFLNAIINYIAANKFFPTISEINDLCNEQRYMPAELIHDHFKNSKNVNPLVAKAYRLAGISKFDLGNTSIDTSIRYIQPKVMKVYKALIKEETQNKLKQIKSDAMKFIENK